ncbi:DUF397 domain-containing protein [Actinomadura rubrisoli]|uniref:DUF397 domain-containing protein n=1 Tax=Actinomadura rubrisoli TaxID=2530368 RepID=A0A4R5C6I4_9ACTN|nr:DUF397 domain-containing protein [Actinomadura rubrisoli]TDD94156.1 DUF397 domain-containing protein [Actinomadura rubrisoli]
MTKQAGEPQWRTSSYTERQDCVALAALNIDSIGIRDSKNPKGPLLSVTRADLENLIDRIKAGHLDRS